MNKYVEDVHILTVANRLADIIVKYEISKRNQIDDNSDFEVDE